MTYMEKLGNIVRLAAAAVLIAAALSCTRDEQVTGSLELASDRILISDAGTPVLVSLDANIEWRIEYDTDNGWMSTDLMGGKASTKGFMVEGTENTGESLRYQTIRVFTVDHAAEKEVTVIQLSSYPAIIFESTSMMSLMAAEARYSIAFTANVPNDGIKATPSADWLKDVTVTEDGNLVFTASENTDDVLRQGYIELVYEDENGRRAEAIVKVEQAAPSIYNEATPIDFSQAAAIADGTVEDNVCIEGIITSTGTSQNMPANRYILQSETGHGTVVFESSGLIAFTQFDRVSLALKDTRVETETEGGFSYKVFKDVTVSHILKFEDSEFTVPDVKIADLTDDMTFNIVTLTDVEVALAAGAYTNFKTCWPGNTEQKAPDYFVLEFPDFYRWYPVPVRDKDGGSIYRLTTLDAPWAHTTLPEGSGTLTGIVMKVNMANFDIDGTSLCIVPLSESDLGIDGTANEVSQVIAGWDCNLKYETPDNSSSAMIFPENEYNPDEGILAGQPGVVLNKNGNTGFQQYYALNILGYQDSFRGDVNLSDAADGWYSTLSGGYYGRVSGGAFNSQPWNKGELHTDFFYIDGISTSGYTGPLSLQVSMNTGGGAPVFALEYASALSDPWTEVTRFKVLPQLDRTDSGRQTETNVPGYKFYDFELPDGCLNQDNLAIRLRIVSDEKDPRIRLDHIQLKCAR